MGLISRVSSRTYRSSDTTKMIRATRILRHLTPREMKNGTGVHHGLRPIMEPKKDISALIQVSRRAALIFGMWYGNKRWHEIAAIRGAEKAAEVAAFNAQLAKEAAAAQASQEEFARTSILYGNPEQ